MRLKQGINTYTLPSSTTCVEGAILRVGRMQMALQQVSPLELLCAIDRHPRSKFTGIPTVFAVQGNRLTLFPAPEKAWNLKVVTLEKREL